MLIDEVTIKVNAGDGGRGAVAFNKNKMSLGPTGGSGGKGGSVYFEGVSDLSSLNKFRYKKEISAENGAVGGEQFRDGPDGEDLLVKIPVGTVISKIETGESEEILKTGEKLLIAKGGIGGKGNFRFRSPTNTTPKQYQEGRLGEQFTLKLELKLIADVGFIGLPNVGKSSLLNELTRAQSVVANYPFTTLEPNLGAYYELILADIPGLIEGASGGKGLGTKFLRHIERTKILFHLISAESENPAKDYKTIKEELAAYSPQLTKKKEFVFLSKSDLVAAADLKNKIAPLKKINKNVIPISIHDWDSLEKVKKILNKIKEEK
ncbi:MAG: GTPase obg [candidate division CPR1 bacterium GW2011_GWC1_49_13]|uniref:GTPase Obg n=1 Tax=candidate division CPR1 bacterium GW2011_GWC1_49_13 TaxID=1618342 RepID=A0A0G1VFX9_9BACT|nr:MAG: GTPase obg [candidate division CPR1 bacterium GW2011_GWC1_49_13]